MKYSSNFGNFTDAPDQLSSGAYFSDGYRIVDFVLAYRPPSTVAGRKTHFENSRFRTKFEAALKAENLILEYDGRERSRDGKTVFIKIHATWEALTRQAELEELQMPIRKSDLPPKQQNLVNRILRKLLGKNPFELQDEYKIISDDFYTSAFSRNRQEQFLIQDRHTFFSPAQRVFLVWSILCGITISLEFKQKKRKVVNSDMYGMESIPIPDENTQKGTIKTANIQYLLRENIYHAAYPLHDGQISDSMQVDDLKNVPVQLWPLRNYLYESWARPSQWYRQQPLDQIRNYYGEKVALYFAWLGFYTKMLIAPAMVGTLIFLAGLIYGPFSEFAKSFCSSEGAYGKIGDTLVCRTCARIELCPFMEVRSFCKYALINAAVDNFGTTVFAVFMAVWVILFLEFWKRYQSELCTRWNVDQLNHVEPQVRTDYTLSVKTTRFDQFTKKHEPYLPPAKASQRMALSITIVCFFIAIVIGLVVSVMIYKVIGPYIWLKIYTDANLEVIVRAPLADFEPMLSPNVTNETFMEFEQIYDEAQPPLTDLNITNETIQQFSELDDFQIFENLSNETFLQLPEFPLVALDVADVAQELVYIFNPALMTSITATLINGLFIAIMTKVYIKVAWKLTTFELPRTEQEFEQSYIYKVSVFQCVNFYSSLFYLALIRGFPLLISAPSSGLDFNTKCPISGCLVDVTIQLAIIMTGKQILNNFQELGIPLMKNYLWKRKFEAEDDLNMISGPERDFNLLPVPPINQFGDYLEMLIQFGFITMFGPAFTLAPLFALINNIVEIRLDAYKMVTQTRRCIPQRASNIEPWFSLMNALGKLALVTNAFIIAFTTNYIDQFVLDMFKYFDYSTVRQNTTLVEFMLSKADTTIFCRNSTDFDCFDITHYEGNTLEARECFYRDYRTERAPYDRNHTWFTVMLAKFAFVLIFEHVVLLVQAFVSFAVPDVPEHVKQRTQRKTFLQRQAFKQHEYEGVAHEQLMVEDLDESEEEWMDSGFWQKALDTLQRKKIEQQRDRPRRKPFYVVLFKKLSLC